MKRKRKHLTTKNNHVAKRTMSISSTIDNVDLKGLNFDVDEISNDDDPYGEEEWNDDYLNVNLYIERSDTEIEQSFFKFKKSEIKKIRCYISDSDIHKMFLLEKKLTRQTVLLHLGMNKYYYDSNNITMLVLCNYMKCLNNYVSLNNMLMVTLTDINNEVEIVKGSYLSKNKNDIINKFLDENVNIMVH